MNTIDYLEAVKQQYKWDSDYKLAKGLDISRSRVSNYRTGKTEMDSDLCIVVANLLKLNPAIVLIDITAERTKDKNAAKILHKTAKELTSAAASLFITIVMLNAVLYPSESVAMEAETLYNNVYYVK